MNLTSNSFPIHSTSRNCYEPTLLIDKITGDKIELIQIECGEQHTVGLTKNGQVVSWGEDNGSGQLGRGDKVEGLDGLVITKVSCGISTAAITDKGELLTWYSYVQS